MRLAVSDWVSRQVRTRFAVLSTASTLTFRPSSFARDVCNRTDIDIASAMRFFWTCVGIVLAVEAAFSFGFATEFSDIVHHSFPVLVVLTAGFTIWLILKLLLTKGLRLDATLALTLYTGGAAILFTVVTVFALLTADFLASQDAVRASPCRHRTIICLISGGALTEYDIPRGTTGSLGTSVPAILLIILAAVVHYTRVLAKALQAVMGTARWRSYIATVISLVLLSPVAILTVNAIYRLIYR